MLLTITHSFPPSLPASLPHLHLVIKVIFLHVVRALPELLLLAIPVERDGTAHLLTKGGRDGGRDGGREGRREE